MENTRKFTFNNKTDKTAFLIVNPKKKNQATNKLKTQIKRGEIQRATEYKYVGEWYTEKSNHEKSNHRKKEKS